jgi:hypothetical protein
MQIHVGRIQWNKATAMIYFIRIMHYESISEVDVLLRGLRNSPVSLASNLAVYMVRTDLKGISTTRCKSDATASVAPATERLFGRLKPSPTRRRLTSAPPPPAQPHTNWAGCCVGCRVLMNVAINSTLLGLSEI